MLENGNIIYFPSFYFKNGNTAKAKYFIVLKIIDGSSILASLPTRSDYIPTNLNVAHGCIEHPELSINCYKFEAQRIITDNNWAFPIETFLYGQQIDLYESATLCDIYPLKGIDYNVLGKLSLQEYNSLIECLSTSDSVKNKFKRILQ